MGKRVDIAKRLEELGVDPVAGMVRIAKRAERSGNLALAGKILGDLLEYTAPKLKAVEHSIEPETRNFLQTREERRLRIAELLAQTKMAGDLPVVTGELLHIPDEP